MNRRTRFFAGILAVAAFVALTSIAGATPDDLEIVKFGVAGADSEGLPPQGRMIQSGPPQWIKCEIGERTPASVRSMEMLVPSAGDEKPAFDEVVTKDRDYETDFPFRGVLELGDGFYGIAFDAVNAGEDAVIPFFNRLYIDMDHDGDLTDEEVIKAVTARASNNKSTCNFGVIDITIEAGGVSYDFAVHSTIRSKIRPGNVIAKAQFSASAYRAGEIEIDGETHQVILVDHNNNGRFNDVASITDERWIVHGDMIYMDPDNPTGTGPKPPRNRIEVGDIFNMAGTYYDMKVSPSGNHCSPVPPEYEIGYVETAVDNFQAVAYGDLGVRNISSDESGKAPLPAGVWNILSYTLDAADGDDDEKDPSKQTTASVRSLTDVAPVTVIGGETLDLKLGAPFRGIVDVQVAQNTRSVSLGLTIVGASSESGVSLTVNGKRPPAHKFTITNATGEVVVTGAFGYG